MRPHNCGLSAPPVVLRVCPVAPPFRPLFPGDSRVQSIDFPVPIFPCASKTASRLSMNRSAAVCEAPAAARRNRPMRCIWVHRQQSRASLAAAGSGRNSRAHHPGSSLPGPLFYRIGGDNLDTLDSHAFVRPILRMGWRRANFLQNVVAFDQFAERGVLVIEEFRISMTDEKLAAR